MESSLTATDQVLGLKFIAMDPIIMDILNMTFMKARVSIYGMKDSTFLEIFRLGKWFGVALKVMFDIKEP